MCVGVCVVISMLIDPKIKERVHGVVLFRVILLILMIPMLLIVMLKALVEARLYTCYVVGKEEEYNISHLQYSDDTIIVGEKVG